MVMVGIGKAESGGTENYARMNAHHAGFFFLI